MAEAETSEASLALLQRVFQPPVFFAVVSHLSFDDAVSFHDAFPLMSPLWENSANYVRWFHRHVQWGHRQPPGAARLTGVTNEFEKITFDLYVQHVHWHLHGKLSSLTSNPRYKTDVLHLMGMAPLDRHFAVKDCLFLPSSSPGVFSGNLALLGSEGELSLFHSGSCEYVMTACLQLDFAADSLFCSPAGSLLVAASCRGFTTVVDLSGPAPLALVTKVSVPRDNFHRSCFADERSFLYWSDATAEWTISRCSVSHAGGVEQTGFADHSSLGPIFEPVPQAYRSLAPVLTFRPSDGRGRRGMALFWERHVGGFSNRLRVLGETSGGLEVGTADHFHTFDHCRVCSAVFSPDNVSLFVLVIFEGEADAFWTEKVASRSKLEPPLDRSCLASSSSRFGRCAVYRMVFDSEGICSVAPRFYSGPWTDPETPHFPHHWKGHLNFSRWSAVDAYCTDTHLTIKYSDGTVCHFSHIGGQLSQPYYDAAVSSKLFAVSENHKHHAYFLGDRPYCEDNLRGYRECHKYDRTFRVRENTVPLRLPHHTISLTYL